MTCRYRLCRLNDLLLEMLPHLPPEEQQRVLKQWPAMDPIDRDLALKRLRILLTPPCREADLAELAKLADYFKCGVYDVVRYTRDDE